MKYLGYLPAFVASAAISAALVAGCSGTSDPQGEAYKTVVQFTTDLQKRNFYDACSLYGSSLLNAKDYTYHGSAEIVFSPIRFCAIGMEANEAQSLSFTGDPVFESFKVNPRPVSGHGTPKNGYVFKVVYYQGIIYVAVQRDKSGDWKIVAVS